jgi:hypothetical protein
MVIWSLFDSENDTVKNTFPSLEVYSYGFNYLKPTTIYSNIEMQLQNNSPNTELQKLKNHISGYTKFQLSKLRSKVPSGLYLDIFEQAKTGGVPLLNFPPENKNHA